MFASATFRSVSGLRSRRGLSISELILVLATIVGVVGGLWCWQGGTLSGQEDTILPTADSGHTAAVYAVVITPDQQNVITIGLGGTMRTFSFATGECLNEMGLEYGDCRCLVYSPDGRLLLVGAVTGQVQLWDFGSKEVKPHLLKGHQAEILCAGFHPSGKFFVTCDKDLKCIAWSTATFLPLWSRENSTGAITTLSFSSDGQRFVTGDLHGYVKTWDAVTGALQSVCHVEQTDFTPLQRIVAVRCIPDSDDVVVAASTGPIQVWDLRSRQCKMRFQSGTDTRSLVLSSDGNTLVSGETDGDLSVWDMRSGTRRKSWRAHTAAVLGLEFNADESRFASVGWDGRMKTWNL